eukprot:6030026-Pleurochrysis_carterae.AAC.1
MSGYRGTITHCADEILNLIKAGNLATVLADGKAKPQLLASPLFKKAASRTDENTNEPAPDAAASEDVARNIQFEEDEFDELEGEAGADEEEEARRAREAEEERAAAKPAGARKPATKSAKAAGKQPVKQSERVGAGKRVCPIDINAEEEVKGKRPYRMTGLFSKDPVKAALARAKLGSGDTETMKTPSQRSSDGMSTTSVGRISDLNEIVRLKATNKELYDKLQQKDNEIVVLRSEVSTFNARLQLAVKETELKMRDKMDGCYELGRTRAFKQLEEAKQFMNH